MADNLRKYTTQEVLNKVYTDSSGNAIGINSSTTKETLNAVFSTSDNSLNVALSGGTISGDVTIDGDLTVNGTAGNAFDEIINGDLHVKTNSTDAFLVEKADGTDVFIVDTTNSRVGIGTSPSDTLHLSASVPIIRLTDSDTDDYHRIYGSNGGLYFDADKANSVGSSVMGFGVDDVRVMTLVSGGSVGIGISIPTHRLSVVNSGGATDMNIGTYSAGKTVGVLYTSADTNGYFAIQSYLSQGSTFGDIILNPSGGNVGIGSVSPISNLEIKGTNSSLDGVSAGLVVHDSGSANAGLQLINNSGKFALHADGANDRVDFYVDNATTGSSFAGGDKILTLKYGGNVGISQDNPQSKLHINVGTDQNLEVTSVSNKIHLMGTNDARNANIPLTLGFTEYDFEGATGSTIRLKSTNSNITTSELVGKLEAYISDTSGDLPGVAGSIDWTTNGSIDGGLTKGTNFTLKTYLESAGLVTNMVLDGNSRISLSNNDSGGTGGSDATSANTILGWKAGHDIIATGVANSFVGHAAGFKNTTGDSNSGFGRYAGFGNLDGDGNTFVGSNAGLSDNSDSHSYNTGIGFEVLKDLTDGSFNEAMGKQALQNLTTGDSNIAIGTDALGSATTSHNLIAIGRGAGYAINNETADGTIAIGRSALALLTSGANNTAIGYQSLDACTVGNSNVAVGNRSLGGNVDGVANVGMGLGALELNVSGNYNTAFGHQALQNFNSNIDGENTAVGINAGQAVSTGRENTILGAFAGDAITAGVQNVIVGADSDISAVDSGNEVVLGYGVTGVGANQVSLGNTAISAINAQVTSITAYSSDERTKKNVEDYDLKGVDFIKDLSLKTYIYKNPADYPDEIRHSKWDEKDEDGKLKYERLDDPTETQVGLIAQEVIEALEKHNVGNTETYAPTQDSGIKTLTYGNLIFPLIKAVQELSARVEELEKK